MDIFKIEIKYFLIINPNMLYKRLSRSIIKIQNRMVSNVNMRLFEESKPPAEGELIPFYQSDDEKFTAEEIILFLQLSKKIEEDRVELDFLVYR